MFEKTRDVQPGHEDSIRGIGASDYAAKVMQLPRLGFQRIRIAKLTVLMPFNQRHASCILWPDYKALIAKRDDLWVQQVSLLWLKKRRTKAAVDDVLASLAGDYAGQVYILPMRHISPAQPDIEAQMVQQPVEMVIVRVAGTTESIRLYVVQPGIEIRKCCRTLISVQALGYALEWYRDQMAAHYLGKPVEISAHRVEPEQREIVPVCCVHSARHHTTIR